MRNENYLQIETLDNFFNRRFPNPAENYTIYTI